MRESIKQILIRRDGMSEDEAEDLIAEAKDAMLDCLDDGDFLGAESICEEYFGLEPDYIDDLI